MQQRCICEVAESTHPHSWQLRQLWGSTAANADVEEASLALHPASLALHPASLALHPASLALHPASLDAGMQTLNALADEWSILLQSRVGCLDA